MVYPLIALVFFCSAANADSDGYFCSSRNFLAYEYSISTQPFYKHKLYIYRFGQEINEQHNWIEIPNFQLHSMECYDHRVEMAGWEKHYVYDVTPDSVIPTLEENLEAPGIAPDHLPSKTDNLGMLSPVINGAMPEFYTFELWPDSPVGKHEIRIQRANFNNACEHKVESRLVKIGQDGNDEVLRVLFFADVSVECG